MNLDFFLNQTIVVLEILVCQVTLEGKAGLFDSFGGLEKDPI